MTSLFSEKPQILDVVINIYFTLGRAQAQQKKYPFVDKKISASIAQLVGNHFSITPLNHIALKRVTCCVLT